MKQILILKTILLTFALVGCMDSGLYNPEESKQENKFFAQLENDYGCTIQRSVSTPDIPQEESEYGIILIDYPDSNYLKGDEYMDKKALEIAERVHYFLKRNVEIKYQKVLIGLNSKSHGAQQRYFDRNQFK